MQPNFRRLPDSELRVMQVLWEAGQAVTRPAIDAALSEEKAWSASTVVALLTRLESKGFLRHEKCGRGYLYSACIGREEYLAAESKTLLGTLYGGSPKNFIAALHSADALSQSDIHELEAYLDRAKKGEV